MRDKRYIVTMLNKDGAHTIYVMASNEDDAVNRGYWYHKAIYSDYDFFRVYAREI